VTKRRIVLAVMALVTAWSVWSFAQTHGRRPNPPPGVSGHSLSRPGPPTGKAPPGVVEAKAEEKGEGGGGEASHEHEGPGAFNWTQFGTSTPPFVAMLVNFGILAAGYYLLGKKPIAAALQSRRDTIAKDIDEAQKMRREAEERAKTYQAKLEKLEDEVKTAREALVRAGEAERDRIVSDAEATAERMRKDAEFLVEQELKQIRQDLWKDTVDTAVAAAEELLKKRVTAADQERIAEDYLADLGGKKSPSIAPGAASGSGTPTQESAS
jgi:F-type H+-transporting ATPase subunit b